MEGGEGDPGDLMLQVPQGPSEQGQHGARRHYICSDKNQMAQRAGGLQPQQGARAQAEDVA